jgi:Gpi18-like mannosyltransferase
MEVPPENGTVACIWLGDSLRITERAAVCITIAAAFAVRLYLGLTSFCISGDGAGYLGMAHRLAAGEWTKGFDAVFSPLYPLLIAGAHRLIPGWEIAGNMVSVVMGTGAVAAIYLMFREAFGRRDFALGAAALAAIHPDLAAYSASVRTEAGYLCLLATASWLLLRGLNHRAIGACAMAGAVGGLAYLYRSEGIGFLAIGVMFIAALALVWKTAPPRWALGAAAIFAAAFLAVASPYIMEWAISPRKTAINGAISASRPPLRRSRPFFPTRGFTSRKYAAISSRPFIISPRRWDRS